jgi:hypothetical protein
MPVFWVRESSTTFHSAQNIANATRSNGQRGGVVRWCRVELAHAGSLSVLLLKTASCPFSRGARTSAPLAGVCAIKSPTC